MSDFHPLLEEQLPRLMRYATALTRDSEAAEELVEDTVREALAQAPQPHRGTGLRVWLLTILHEQHDNPFRRPALATGATGSRVEPEDAMLSRFDHALGLLPDEQRAVLLLIGLEGMTYDDTAAILGISVATMRSRMVRARDSLSRAMGAPAPAERKADGRRGAPAPRRRPRRVARAA